MYVPKLHGPLLSPRLARFCMRLSCVALLGGAASCSKKEPPSAAAPPSVSAEPPSAATPAAPAAATATAASDAKHAETASFFAVHSLTDFESFKKYFEAGTADRAKFGVNGYLFTRMDDGRVVIHFFADNVETVQTALKSAEMVKYLDRKGAPEASLSSVTRDVIVNLPVTPPTDVTYSLYVKEKFGDFAALERGFRERHALFAAQGVIAEGLHRSATTEDVAVLHFVGTSREKLEALPKLPEFVELMKLAKSKDPVESFIGIDVARDRPK